MNERRFLAAGNWKMNGAASSLDELGAISEAARGMRVESLLCLPATLIDRARTTLASEPSHLRLGAQDCHPLPGGAHTGDLSAEILADAGASHIIVGHSERRQNHDEGDALVAEKAKAAWRAGLSAIICIGESEAQYRARETLDVLQAQIRGSLPAGAKTQNTVVAYEPIWAIGTGLTPSLEEIGELHAAIRAALPDPDLSILYGGSVKPDNAAEIFALPDVDGGLVGGASLRANDFIPIMRALEAAKGTAK